MTGSFHLAEYPLRLSMLKHVSELQSFFRMNNNFLKELHGSSCLHEQCWSSWDYCGMRTVCVYILYFASLVICWHSFKPSGYYGIWLLRSHIHAWVITFNSSGYVPREELLYNTVMLFGFFLSKFQSIKIKNYQENCSLCLLFLWISFIAVQ